MQPTLGSAVRSDLDGKYALVTGAVGGVGSAVVDLLVRSGCHVALADKNNAALDVITQQMDPGHERTLTISYDALLHRRETTL